MGLLKKLCRNKRRNKAKMTNDIDKDKAILDIEYYQFDYGRIFKFDPNTKRFYELNENGEWIIDMSLIEDYYGSATFFDVISEQDVLNYIKQIKNR